MVNVEEIVRAEIAKMVHMSLGTCVDNKPWVCEVHFAYDDKLNLYFRSKPSRRHSQEIEQNPYVAGNIVQQFALNDDKPIMGIYFEGKAEKLNNVDEQHPAYVALSGRQCADVRSIEESKDPEGHQFYKITVSQFSAFGFFDGSAQKVTIDWN